MRARFTAALAAAMLAGAAPATATITETLSINTSGSRWGPAGDLISGPIGNGQTIIDLPGTFQRLDSAVTTMVDPGGNFFFQHTSYILGYGAINMTTVMTLTMTNNGPAARDLRIDSLITPGFIAVQGDLNRQGASFDFTVQLDTGLGPNVLYYALARVNSNALEFGTTGVPLADLQHYNAPGRIGWEWNATPLSITMPTLAPGATHVVNYITNTTISQFGSNEYPCETQLGCFGAQVSFGDPRNDGSVQPNMTSLMSPLAAPATTVQPFIGRQYGVFENAVRTVEQSAPEPQWAYQPLPPFDLAALPAVDGFAPVGAIPEPGSWMMLIAGFGAIGGLQRRRARCEAAARTA